jgi:hypothetical protein
MLVKELIKELSVFDGSAEVIVFTRGRSFPTMGLQKLDDGRVEIGCGWAELEEDESE